MTSRILITGGAGFTGSHLLEADISSAQHILGYQPVTSFEDGLEELAEWLQGLIAVDHVPEAHAELTMQGLTL